METLRLRYGQTRSVLELLNQGRELAAQPDARDAHLGTGLLKILGAQALLQGRVVDHSRDSGYGGRFYHATDVGLAAADRTGFVGPLAVTAFRSDPVAQAHLALVMSSSSSEPVSKLRRQLVDDEGWYHSEYVSQYRRTAHLDDTACSMRRGTGSTIVEGIIAFRQFGDRPFEQEDCDLVHLVHLEWAAMTKANDLADRRLSPREHEVFENLLSGYSYKEIAARMGLTNHTVNEYGKRIYRKFDVHSRGELQAMASRKTRRSS